MGDDICRTSAFTLATRIRNGELSPVAVIDRHLDRIHAINDEINAFVSVFEDSARARAKDAERAVESGEELGPLHGIPVALKDIGYAIEGERMTCGVTPLEDNVVTRDSICVSRLKQAGAIIIGQTNTCEFGYKATTENHLFGPTSTPFDRRRNAGGSSGGSAAAAAAGLAPITMGGDGGGSIRNPASFCGVYGIKPSFGRVPRDSRPNAFHKHTPFADPGPITRHVVDAALVLDVLGRPHERDPFGLPDDGTDYLGASRRRIDDLEIGYARTIGDFPVAAEVIEPFMDAVDSFATAGATVNSTDIDLPHSHAELTDVWLDQVGVVYAAVADSLSRKQGIELLAEHRDVLSEDFVSVIERGYELGAVELRRNEEVRTAFFDALQDHFDEFDLLLTPTLGVPPVENTSDNSTSGPTAIDGVAVDPRIGWCLTHPINFTGHPAASIPAGFTPDGLPVGLQIVGRRHDDESVIAASAAYERTRPWHESYPSL